MRIFPFFMASQWDFSTAVTRERKMNLESLQTLKVAKSSSWQGEIHSSGLLLFSDIPIQSPGGLLLCESATAQEQQPKPDSSEAALIQEGFGSLHWKALKETFQSEKFSEDVCVQKLCLLSSVSSGSRQTITGNSPKLAFFLL